MRLPNQHTLSKRHPCISTANSKAYEKNSEKESTTKVSRCFAWGGKQEWRCIVCGRVFGRRESLQAHLRVHRGELCTFSVRIPRTLREDFKRLCRAHGVTTCHVVVGLMQAAVEGFRRGVAFEWDPRTESVRLKSGSNPLVVNFYQAFGGPPRSRLKHPLLERVHEVELACESCGEPAEFLHLKQDPLVGVVYMALCGVHHKRSLRLGASKVYIMLRDVTILKGWGTEK